MLIYAAAGDSLTVGVGAWPGSGLVPQYRTLASKHLNEYVESFKFAKSGATSGEVLRMVRDNADVRYMMSRADIITLTAGGNDLITAAKQYASRQDPQILEQALIDCRKHYAELVDTIRSLKRNASGRYIIRAADLYNPVPDFPGSALWVQRFNRHIDSLECGHFKVARIYGHFVGREKELLSIDGIHPNAQGYRVIAEQMSSLGYRPLFQSRI